MSVIIGIYQFMILFNCITKKLPFLSVLFLESIIHFSTSVFLEKYI